MSARKTLTASITALGVALSLVACAETPDSDPITLGYLPSWADGTATAYLLEDRLEQLGYEVEHLPQSDATALYTGLASGEIDVFPSAWPEVTHRGYMDRYGDSIEDLGSYYDGAQLNLSVPTYVEDVNEIGDLKGQSERFGGSIHGIEPGSGLTRVTREDVLPGYGLKEEYELETSSTDAMITTLEDALAAKEDVVVTMWTPFWASTELDVKPLEDPEGLFGEPESLHTLARAGFTEEYPEVAKWIGEMSLNDAEYADLESSVIEEKKPARRLRAVREWISRHPDALPTLPEN